jgi:hypothetical protein
VGVTVEWGVVDVASEALADVDVAGLTTFFLTGRALNAGIAPAPLKPATDACCALCESGEASEPDWVAVDEPELFLTADPSANAPPNPTTSATASTSQRLRTSAEPEAGAPAIAATSPLDITVLSI